jgi:hypothetical protein
MGSLLIHRQASDQRRQEQEDVTTLSKEQVPGYSMSNPREHLAVGGDDGVRPYMPAFLAYGFKSLSNDGTHANQLAKLLTNHIPTASDLPLCMCNVERQHVTERIDGQIELRSIRARNMFSVPRSKSKPVRIATMKSLLIATAGATLFAVCAASTPAPALPAHGDLARTIDTVEPIRWRRHHPCTTERVVRRRHNGRRIVITRRVCH